MATVKLTNQQEIFAQEVVKHGNQSEAYRVAYPRSRKWKPETVWSESSTMMTHPKVSERVSELRALIERDAIADASERRRFWTETMRNKDGDMKDRLKASELIGRADGDFVERKKIEGDINLFARVEVVLISADAKG